MKPLVTLTTDFGMDTAAIAAVKGRLHSLLSDFQFIDVSHHINPFDIAAAAIELGRVLPYFGENTLHLVAVDDELKRHGRYLMAQSGSCAVLAADNGIIGLLPEDFQENIREIPDEFCSETLSPAIDIMAPVTAAWFAGGSDGWNQVSDYKRLQLQRPFFADDNIRGNVLYVDGYCNVVTNISREMFNRYTAGRQFSIALNRFDRIHKISESYADVPEGEALAYFNVQGLLSVALNRQKASGLLGLKKMSSIIIEIK